MPLVRKPGLASPAALPDAAGLRQALHSPDSDERWSAAREVATLRGVEGDLATALAIETDARVREAMLSSLACIGTATAIEPLVSMVRSDEAALRTAALDALRLTPRLPQVVTQLLQDPESDVRLLCCDLARALPATQANELLATLLAREPHPNVCAAAVEVLAEVGDATALGGLTSCARRFPANDFLLFAIKTVVDRIQATSASPRV